jgi:hypothetical protein
MGDMSKGMANTQQSIQKKIIMKTVVVWCGYLSSAVADLADISL